MYLPKSDVYNSLKELNYYVSQTQPATFNDLPAIIFSVGNNTVDVDLDNGIISHFLFRAKKVYGVFWDIINV